MKIGLLIFGSFLILTSAYSHWVLKHNEFWDGNAFGAGVYMFLQAWEDLSKSRNDKSN